MPVPPDATEYILSELTRRLNEVASRLEVGLNRMDGVYVRKDVFDQSQATAAQEHTNIRAASTTAVGTLEVALKDNENRIETLEKNRQWVLRMAGSALFTAIVTAVVALVFAVKV